MNIQNVKRFISKNYQEYEENLDYPNYVKPKIKESVTYKRKIPVIFSKEILNKIIECHKLFYERCGSNGCSCSDEPIPLIFMLGQKDNIISEAVHVPAHDGCGYMARITSSNISKAMYELISKKYFPAGIMRVGFFLQYYSSDFGDGLWELEKNIKGQGLAFVSLGYNFFDVRFPNKTRRYVGHSYKIV